jgi:hypothetical protein
MIRYRPADRMIVAGYPDGNDSDVRYAPTRPSRWWSGGRPKAAPICARNRPSAGWKNLPGPIALKRMMAAMVEVFCDSFEAVPRRIVLDINDTEDGSTAASNWRCSTPITTDGVSRRLRHGIDDECGSPFSDK